MAQVRSALRAREELPTDSRSFSRPPLARLAARLSLISDGQAA